MVCCPSVTAGGSGVLVEPSAIDEQFRRAWMPFFCRGDRGHADLDAFRAVAEGLTPLLDEVQFPPLIGDMLFEVVSSKKPTAGSLDGWGWREFKALLVAWFDKLASIFTLVEEEGVWPDGLLDAYIATISKADGDSTPLGQSRCVSFRWLIDSGLRLGLVTWRLGFGLGCLILFSVLVKGGALLSLGILLLWILKNAWLVFWILMFISLFRM